MLQVTKQDGGWYCEYDSKVYPTMVRRYVMLAKCTDAAAELNISIFNEQVRPTPSHRMQGNPMLGALTALLPSWRTERPSQTVPEPLQQGGSCRGDVATRPSMRK